LASVLSQTRPAEEVVIVDDGSTDGSGDAVAEFQTPCVKLIRQQNAGESAARNRGIVESSGDVIASLDADDEWMPDFLATIERLSARHGNAGAFGTAYLFTRDGGKSTSAPAFSPLVPKDGLLSKYFAAVTGGAIPFMPSCAAVRRSTFDAVGTFEVGATWGADAEMWARIYLEFPIAYLAEPLALYHVSAANRVTDRVDPRPMMPVVKTLERALRESRVSPAEVMDAERYICQAISNTVRTNILHGHRALAAEQLKRIRHYPCGRRMYWRLRCLSQLPHFCIRTGLRARNAVRAIRESGR
jgi:glycosyltransferase involved in cell wall biosynthesis